MTSIPVISVRPAYFASLLKSGESYIIVFHLTTTAEGENLHIQRTRHGEAEDIYVHAHTKLTNNERVFIRYQVYIYPVHPTNLFFIIYGLFCFLFTEKIK